MIKTSVWKTKLSQEWERIRTGRSGTLTGAPGRHLSRGVEALTRFHPMKKEKYALPGQPFDCHLLALSPLYRRSRRLFLENKGTFTPSLLSSARTLSSPALLGKHIEYSPIEAELCWSATDPIEKRNFQHLLDLRTFSSSLFHEQNHRLLIDFLPSAPQDSKNLEKYLNFMESLVIALDMALGDELGSSLASLFYQCGVIYDPGTNLKSEQKGKTRNAGLKSFTLSQKRLYRNYLQACLYSTYLTLQFFPPEAVLEITRLLFPALNDLADHAAHRSCRLDREFVHKTNPIWQRKHRKFVLQKLGRTQKSALCLANDPLDNRLHYLWAEKWFDWMGL